MTVATTIHRHRRSIIRGATCLWTMAVAISFGLLFVLIMVALTRAAGAQPVNEAAVTCGDVRKARAGMTATQAALVRSYMTADQQRRAAACLGQRGPGKGRKAANRSKP